ncbi:hypothetical protein T4B_8909 [Trichinella pseudospiralis]|uniref:Uncharacterized protein n=1 Tax=Trichinella pseudospiralis TaxID=6337 RepID=A0A0V1JEH8_TRIPS|nr:hypothetical protein T4B_8909 [Trichinella pseudospiralis]KRZ33388.1 hypothetical protein T4C_9450 [Trichinella pseudospiralis]
MDAMMDPMKRIGRLFNAYILCCLGGGCVMSGYHFCGTPYQHLVEFMSDEIRCFQENDVSAC